MRDQILRNTLLVPPRIYAIIRNEKLTIVPGMYCPNEDIILADENGRIMTFRLLPPEDRQATESETSK